MTFDEYLESVGWDGESDEFGRDLRSLQYDYNVYGYGPSQVEYTTYDDGNDEGFALGGGPVDSGDPAAEDPADPADPSGEAPSDIDYDAFRQMLLDRYDDLNTPGEAMTPSGDRTLQTARGMDEEVDEEGASYYLSNEMRGIMDEEPFVDYGEPEEREPLDFAALARPRSRPPSVRPARNATRFKGIL